MHSNPGTFEKNFILSPEQKEYSIKKYESVVSAILEPEMSDLEKYYTLATWLNHHVNYDWLFWPGPYDFDYYSHQWDAYGVIKSLFLHSKSFFERYPLFDTSVFGQK